MHATPAQPLYQIIVDEIQHQILSGEHLPGDQIPTEMQLMKEYDVSRITVSRALTELKERKLLVSYRGRGTFVADTFYPGGQPQIPQSPSTEHENLSAFSLKAGSLKRKKEIACIMPDLSDLFALSVIKGFNSVFSTEDYLLHLFQSDNPDLERYLLRYCMESGFSGIALFPQDVTDSECELEDMRQQNYPLVFMDRCPPVPDISYVVADHDAAGALCLKHLYSLGHTRIAFVTVSSATSFAIRHRISGAKNSAGELGIPKSDFHVIEGIDMKKSYAHYKDQFLHLILEDRVTAFVALESAACIYLYELFQYLKLEIPSRISLMTFDKPVTNLHGPNFFTHIDQSEFRIGKNSRGISAQPDRAPDGSPTEGDRAPTLRPPLDKEGNLLELALRFHMNHSPVI